MSRNISGHWLERYRHAPWVSPVILGALLHSALETALSGYVLLAAEVWGKEKLIGACKAVLISL